MEKFNVRVLVKFEGLRRFTVKASSKEEAKLKAEERVARRGGRPVFVIVE